MRRQHGIKGIRHQEMCVLGIGTMHVSYLIYCYYLFFFVTYVLSLDKIEALLVYLSPSVMRCIAAELLHVSQTVGVWIRKWLPDWATTDDINSCVGLTKISSFCEIC